jgi:hypothetical protein
LDHHLPDRQRPRHRAETGAQPVSFATRSVLVTGPHEQSHLRTAIRNAHVVAGGVEPARRFVSAPDGRRRSTDFVFVLQVISASDEETTWQPNQEEGKSGFRNGCQVVMKSSVEFTDALIFAVIDLPFLLRTMTREFR